MLRNYLIIAFRNLLRHKMFSLINIGGLATGIAFCLLVYLYVQHERSFDTFHAKKDKLYRLETTQLFNPDKDRIQGDKSLFSFLTKQEEERNQIVMPLVLAPQLKASFPEIKQVLRLKSGWRETVRYNKQSFREEKVQYVDANFFSLFTFPLKSGNPQTVLLAKNNVVISETIARKYFGTANPVGKTLEFVWEKPVLFTITGVAKDAPAHSSIEFDFLLPIESDPDYADNMKNGINTSSMLTFIELADEVSTAAFARKLDRFGKTYFKEWIEGYREDNNPGFSVSHFHFTIRPLAEGHYTISSPWGHFTSLKNIYQLVCLTILILIIACLNYLLLTLTNTAARVQEVGLRKVVGAPRFQIISQFWIETQLLVCIAVLTGWFIAVGLLPYFNELIDNQIQITFAQSTEILLALLITAFLVGILAGFYPALFISGIKPLSIIKKHQTFRLNPKLSCVLVILQYSSCITLLIASLVIARQMKFLNEKDLGFDKEQILVVENPDWGKPQQTQATGERLQAFAASNASITGFTAAGHTFGNGFNMNMENINGKEEGIIVMTIDYSYFDMLDLEIVQGRSFSPEFRMDTARKDRSVVVNETLFHKLGKEAKIGAYNETIRRTIIGVVKDYHYTSLAQPIGSAMHQLDPQWSSYYWLKLSPGNTAQTIEKVRKEWNTITGNQPFNYTFLDGDVAKLYESQQRWLKTIHAATIFAIVVACLGLFGLSGMNALNRTKEIGIRKVLGASTSQIFVLLNKETIRLALISFIIAIPVAYYFMYQWLQDFAYRIELSWEIFAVAGGIGACTALLAVSYHSVKAAIGNPVDALRDE